MDSLTLSQLKAEHPDVYAQAVEEGKATGMTAGITEGVAKERKRREALLAFKGKGSKAADVAIEAAIASGKTFGEALPEITAAAIFSNAGENAPAIGTATPDGAAGVGTISTEDRAWYLKHGASADDLKKIAAQSVKEE